MHNLARFLSRYAFGILLVSGMSCNLLSAEICGVTVTPHVVADSMMYRKPREPDLAAKVQLFVKGSALPRLFDGKSPSDHLESGDWAWHDLGTAIQGTEDSLSVWTWNGKTSRWGIGNTCEVEGVGLSKTSISIDSPQKWVSAITFLADEAESKPRQMIAHVVNNSEKSLGIISVRFWLPRSGSTWQTLYSQEAHAVDLQIPPGDRGIVKLSFKEPLPLTYAALELTTDSGSLWEHLRIKSEQFDISGGWIGENLKDESYLKLLSRLHVNCGQIQNVAGYTDNAEWYQRYPMKLFNRMWPLETWDTEEWLPKIHAVEFLGEPQYGGGRPVAPQEVFDKLLPYRTSRLATSVTNSEERIWRFYAGLSDYPHYDAYRVVAPAADSWRAYDRWGGKRITWGAPLETIGDLCRSLRELSRPMPVAYWSQGPHDGWGSGFGLTARQRRSPTPDELRAQAMHALSTRITSLYWFNLSLKSLLKFPDTWDPIMRIGREIHMLSPFYLSGDAFHFERTRSDSGQLDWDCASIVSEECAILFANDLAYAPDPRDNTFRFGQPRDFSHHYPLPHWLREPTDVFRVDADGIHTVQWTADSNGVTIKHQFSRDAMFVATKLPSLRKSIEARRQAAIAKEESHQVDLDKLKQSIRN
jgi:hypothetical protein